MAKARDPFRIVFLVAFLLCAAGCGFHPIYGARDDHSPVAAELNDVAIDNIADRNGQRLRNDLIDRMYVKGRPHNPKYTLTVKLQGVEEGIGLLPNATTSLTELTLYGDYSFKDQTGKELFHARAHAVATYNQFQEQYATLAASENAYQRCIDEVSDQIVERISLYFSEGTVVSSPLTPPRTKTTP